MDGTKRYWLEKLFYAGWTYIGIILIFFGGLKVPKIFLKSLGQFLEPFCDHFFRLFLGVIFMNLGAIQGAQVH